MNIELTANQAYKLYGDDNRFTEWLQRMKDEGKIETGKKIMMQNITGNDKVGFGNDRSILILGMTPMKLTLVALASIALIVGVFKLFK